MPSSQKTITQGRTEKYPKFQITIIRLRNKETFRLVWAWQSFMKETAFEVFLEE